MSSGPTGFAVYPLYLSLKGCYKAKGGDEVVRRQRLNDVSYEGMLSAVSGWVGGRPSVRYIDEEGDEVTVGSALEWQECARSFIARGTCVRVILGKEAKGSEAHGNLQVPTTQITIDDQWGLISRILEEELGTTAQQKLNEAGCIPLPWVQSRGSYLLVSRQYLTQTGGNSQPQPSPNPFQKTASVGTNAVAAVECIGTATEVAKTFDISVGTQGVTTCDVQCDTREEEEEDEEEEEGSSYSYEVYEEGEEDGGESAAYSDDDDKDADDVKEADGEGEAKYEGEINVIREFGIQEPREVLVNMLEEMNGSLDLTICALLEN